MPIDRITLQPGDPAVVLTPLPYPFHVNPAGGVGRQDFWRGSVSTVIGFVDDPDSTDITLTWRDVYRDPQTAVGKYVVTADDHGQFSTHRNAISSVVAHKQEG